VLQRRLGRDECAADIEVDHLVQFFQRGLFELLGDRGAGIVHQHVEAPEGGDGFFDRGLDRSGVGGIRSNRDRLATGGFDGPDHRRRGVRAFGVSDGHLGAVGGQALGDRSTNAARAAGDERHFAFEFLGHGEFSFQG
jgi:hypothetical protein